MQNKSLPYHAHWKKSKIKYKTVKKTMTYSEDCMTGCLHAWHTGAKVLGKIPRDKS